MCSKLPNQAHLKKHLRWIFTILQRRKSALPKKPVIAPIASSNIVELLSAWVYVNLTAEVNGYVSVKKMQVIKKYYVSTASPIT